MRIVGLKLFSMLRDQPGWNYMHCFQTALQRDNSIRRLYDVEMHMLSEIKRRPLQVTPKKIKNE